MKAAAARSGLAASPSRAISCVEFGWRHDAHALGVGQHAQRGIVHWQGHAMLRVAARAGWRCSAARRRPLRPGLGGPLPPDAGWTGPRRRRRRCCMRPAVAKRQGHAGRQFGRGYENSVLGNMGKLYPEVCTRLVRHQGDASAVRGNVFMHDGQADAAAAHHVGGLAFTAVEGLENPLAVAFRDPHALVVDVDAGKAALVGQLDGGSVLWPASSGWRWTADCPAPCRFFRGRFPSPAARRRR
jgi:hypothetical protein